MIKTNIFKVVALAFATVIVSTGLFAQKGPVPLFDKTIHDFGEIYENGGSVTYTFEFINSGDQPLVISGVSASCGCTTPGWTREPIAPGARGEVKATYNPYRRPGRFDKTLTVSSNGNPNRIVLRIQGTVSKQPVDLRVLYPDSIGGLRLKSKSVDLGPASTDSPSVITLETANAQDKPVSFSFANLPAYIKAVAEPSTLQPKQKGIIRITSTGENKTLGYFRQNLNVTAGSAKGTIEVTGLTRETFAKDITPDKSPKAVIPTTVYKFDPTSKGKTITATYDVTNDGSTDLVIHNITSNSSSVKSTVKNVKIKPGKTSQIKVNYIASQEGNNDVQLYLATNDPNNALATVKIQGNVTK